MVGNKLCDQRSAMLSSDRTAPRRPIQLLSKEFAVFFVGGVGGWTLPLEEGA